MSKNRPMWEDSALFPTALSQKPNSAPLTKKAKLEDNDTNKTAEERKWSPGCEGCTYELCAGLVDKDASLEQIAKEEILEETGYNVPVDAIEYVNSYCSSIGTGGTQQQLFYCVVTDDMLVHEGGGNDHEGEMIQVVYVPVEESLKLVFDHSQPKSVGLCFAFFWFDKVKRPQLKI